MILQPTFEYTASMWSSTRGVSPATAVVVTLIFVPSPWRGLSRPGGAVRGQRTGHGSKSDLRVVVHPHLLSVGGAARLAEHVISVPVRPSVNQSRRCHFT